MRYVPTGSEALAPLAPVFPTSLVAAARRSVHDLRIAAERRAWAARPVAAASAGAAAPAALLPELLVELRAVTTRYVGGLRAEGARPEQMLVRVKAFVREAMAAEGWHDPEAARALTAHVVDWSIAAYYEP